MRILLLKSLLLCTNCPSFLPILCGILFVLAVDSFVYIPSFFSFLPWICFCCGCLCVYSFFLFVFAVNSFVYISSYFLFFSFLPCSFNFLPRNPKNVGDLLEKVHRFSEKVHRFFVFLGDVAKLSCFQMCL